MIALAGGYPDLANARILDGTRSVLHMQCSNLNPAQQRGIQLANAISLAPVTGGLHLHVDLGFQHLTGGTNSSVTLRLTGSNTSLQLQTQDSIPRQVACAGFGSGGAFSANSGSKVYTNLTYYHFTVDVFANGTTVSLLSDNNQTVFWQYTTTALQLNDFGGSLGLQVYQVTGGGVAENYLDQFCQQPRGGNSELATCSVGRHVSSHHGFRRTHPVYYQPECCGLGCRAGA